nr:dihydrofolate reductase [uncultured Gellertiella sp.]
MSSETTGSGGDFDITFVVAVSENGVIGREGDMPWQLSSDLKRFKALTLGRPVIMGRKTFQTIGRPLPGRDNIVVTRDETYAPEGVQVVSSVDAAIALGKKLAAAQGLSEIAVIGGGQIYAQTMDRATILHVTHVEKQLAGDTMFPAIDPAIWESGPEEHLPEGPKDSFPTRFVTYTRRRHAA